MRRYIVKFKLYLDCEVRGINSFINYNIYIYIFRSIQSCFSRALMHAAEMAGDPFDSVSGDVHKISRWTELEAGGKLNLDLIDTKTDVGCPEGLAAQTFDTLTPKERIPFSYRVPSTRNLVRTV